MIQSETTDREWTDPRAGPSSNPPIIISLVGKKPECFCHLQLTLVAHSLRLVEKVIPLS